MKGIHNAHNVVGKGKPWKKGQSGNPKGRKKNLPAIDELLEKVLSAEVGGHTEAENILLAMIRQAKKGDVRAAELLIDRGYGKLGIRIDVMAGRLATADLFPDELKFFEAQQGQTLTDDNSSNGSQPLPPYRQEADKSEP
jgi:hypothetical protein